MPYRRLPNTDTARLKALNTALKMSNKKGTEGPLSAKSLYNLRLIIFDFEQVVDEYRSSFATQKENKRKHTKLLYKCKLYISHFIQVVNLAVIREEFSKSIRKYYELPLNSNRLPSLQSEKQLIKWGKIIIEGEQKRQLIGEKPIQNPTLINVKNSYDNFIDSYYLQKNLIKRTNNAQSKLVEIRPKVDDLMKNLWDEIEEFFEKYPAIVRREKAKSFGINYIYRKTEEKIELNDLLNF